MFESPRRHHSSLLADFDDVPTREPMTDKFHKIKLSRHQQQNLNYEVPGHDLTREEAEEIIRNPAHTDTQPDGRERFWGFVRSKQYRVAVSATVSAAVSGVVSVGRVVTGHRDRTPRG